MCSWWNQNVGVNNILSVCERPVCKKLKCGPSNAILIDFKAF